MSLNYLYSVGKAKAWALRWCYPCKHDKYCVSIEVGNYPDACFFFSNFDAVVDDFGNLVRVS
jgi:hypothetical protein